MKIVLAVLKDPSFLEQGLWDQQMKKDRRARCSSSYVVADTVCWGLVIQSYRRARTRTLRALTSTFASQVITSEYLCSSITAFQDMRS